MTRITSCRFGNNFALLCLYSLNVFFLAYYALRGYPFMSAFTSPPLHFVSRTPGVRRELDHDGALTMSALFDCNAPSMTFDPSASFCSTDFGASTDHNFFFY